MKPDNRKRLEEAGWKVGSAEELLDLSSEEAKYIDLRIRLDDAVKRLPKEKKPT